MPGPISRFDVPLRDSLVHMGIHEFRPGQHDEACAIQKAFGVYKDAEFARFIQWPEALNESTPDLPCSLPLRGQLHKFLHRNHYAAEDDACDYFFQFEITPGIRKYFAIRVAGVGILYLKRMCMGWKASMAIAQDASNAIARHCERIAEFAGDNMPYADNFLIGSPTRRGFHAMAKAWRKTKSLVNLRTKKDDLEGDMNTSLTSLGLHWDFTHKTLQATRTTMRTLIEYKEKLSSASFREVFHIFGVCNYTRYMMDIPTYRYQPFMMWYRRACSKLAAHPEKWDSPSLLPTSSHKALCKLIADIGAPRLILDEQEMWQASIYTDASNTGGGFVLTDPASMSRGWRWSDTQLNELPDIHHKEAMALLVGVKAALELLPNGTHITAYIDNSILHWNWRGKRAADPRMAKILDELTDILEDHKMMLTTKWIPHTQILRTAYPGWTKHKGPKKE